MANNNDDEERGDEEKGHSRMDSAKAFFRAMYAGDEPSTATQEAPPVDNRRVQELEAQIKDMEAKVADAEGSYRRMAADFDNFRRRTEREREEYLSMGVRKAADAFIPALDDLDRAMLYLNADTPANKIIESFQLVSQRIFVCLEGCGLKRMVTKGVIFDPRFHEPVQQIETTEHPDGAIVAELRAGYIIGDKVVRPALVNVADNPNVPITPVPEFVAETPVSQPELETATATPPAASEPGLKASGEQAKPDTADGVFDLGDLGEEE